MDWEAKEILALAEQWEPIDPSHHKLAHRGSYLRRVWVSPSTVGRVLSAHGLVLLCHNQHSTRRQVNFVRPPTCQWPAARCQGRSLDRSW